MFGFRWGKRRRRGVEIHPDEILIDSNNLAQYDTESFEGRLERPLPHKSLLFAGGLCGLVFVIFLARAGDLQIVRGEALAKQAVENQLREQVIIADRGHLLDRTGERLAWNDRTDPEADFAQRVYTQLRGVGHVLGYVKPPAKDSSGFYFRETFDGVDGVEKIFNTELAGVNGIDLTETDARGEIVSQAQVRAAQTGERVVLSIDAKLSQGLYDALAARVDESKFEGGASVIMDVRTGELLALVNYPEFSSALLAGGETQAVAQYQNDPRRPFLNRATGGLYAPGSIVKPFVVAGALTEQVIDEHKEIFSDGSISIPNPYFPDKPSIFRDWRANGWADARRALAVSHDIYFYAVGGGFEDQKGMGIRLLDEYFKLFGFGAPAGLAGFSEREGVIPTPEWKEETFDGDPWRLGDTYNTSIGQYGMQVTPLQAARATAALANGGTLLTPTLRLGEAPQGTQLPVGPYALQVAREGMRMAVEEGTAAALNVPYVEVAGKTGTAQVGTRNQFMNSWVIGFFPAENPRYAFATVLERAPAGTTSGAPAAMRAFLDWLHQNAPEYLE
jgi:penicillin-binding protein 2